MKISDLIEVYFLLFTDSFVSAMLLPLNKVLIFKIMNYFGGYNSMIMVFIATIGSALGGMINWYFGWLISIARMKYHQTKSCHLEFLHFLLIPAIALFAWIYVLGSILVLISGQYRCRLLYVTGALLCSYTFYYIIMLS